MDVYRFDPMRDSRWADLVKRHPRGSVFHTPAWLQALQRTYRFEPVALTTSPPDEALANGILFCGIRSRLTGRRLVSLPFSDHCEPLVDDAQDLRALCAGVERLREREGWRYVEIRPAAGFPDTGGGFRVSQTFHLHRLDLRPGLDALVRGLHKDSIRRKLRRAERERLKYEEGRGEELLEKLRHLLDLTRLRHEAPLQPSAWFRNVLTAFGDRASIRLASRDGEPVAGILTLAHGATLVYKYGGSAARLHPLGGVPFVFWNTIQDATRRGFHELDLGRCDLDNTGLATFKEHLGARRSALTYWRSPPGRSPAASDGWQVRVMKQLFTRLPGGVRRAAGAYLYPHLG